MLAPESPSRTLPGTAALVGFYEGMLRIRMFEERVEKLYEEEEIPGIAHLSIGQEAVAVGVCSALEPCDYITSTHRGHGHCLAKGADPGRMFAELLGRVDGYCRGKGGSMHIADPMTGNLGANAIVGGSLAIAAGAGLSAKVGRGGKIVASFIGDGALNEGLLLESMNMASLWALPVVYVCENNQYGEYTPTKCVTAGVLSARGEAFGVPTTIVDGMDVIAVHAAACAAAARARGGLGPSFLICETYRFRGHGMSDRNRAAYRTAAEEEEWLQRDPLERMRLVLIDRCGVEARSLAGIGEQLEQEIESAVEFARRSPFPGRSDVSTDVYAD
jgi:TPP-dependent pyruvate/acetoin dehydrogenase alpha subunit